MNDEFLDLVRSGNFVVLDTETTGLHYPSEIIEIAIIDAAGDTLLNSRIKPNRPIPFEATRVHGISNQDVANSPTWLEIAPKVSRLIDFKNVIIYNAQYDLQLLDWTDNLSGTKAVTGALCNGRCAMMFYADYYGEWDEYHGNNRWQTLGKAIRQQGLAESNAHSALGDALMTLQLIKHIAAKEA